MKFSLVTAIRYLSNYQLAPDEVMIIDTWGHEGYELLTQLRDSLEGATTWSNNPNSETGLEYLDEVKNDLFRCMLDAAARQNLFVHFIGTFPCIDSDENLQVYITPRKIAHDTLTRILSYEGPTFPEKGVANPLQGPNSAKSKPSVKVKDLKKAS